MPESRISDEFIAHFILRKRSAYTHQFVVMIRYFRLVSIRAHPQPMKQITLFVLIFLLFSKQRQHFVIRFKKDFTHELTEFEVPKFTRPIPQGLPWVAKSTPCAKSATPPYELKKNELLVTDVPQVQTGVRLYSLAPGNSWSHCVQCYVGFPWDREPFH